jgi:gluconokinase
MGVSGSGKSTLGESLARRLHLPFVEGDGLHDARNIAKMHTGQALTDADRAGWLEQIAALLQDQARYPSGLVVTCSALKRPYRDQLRRASAAVHFLYLRIDAAEARRRLQHRPQHFMPASLVPSQFRALEAPSAAETDVVTLDAAAAPALVLAAALAALRPASHPSSEAPSGALE